MDLKKLFAKKEAFIGVDIGSSGIKLVELDLSGTKPKLLNLGVVPVSDAIISNNQISNPNKASELVTSLLEANSIVDRRVVTAVPGSSVFTKKIKVQKVAHEELATNIQFEAGNFIPHNINAVKLDFHIIGDTGKGQLDVLVVAVKNEVINSFVDCLGLSGLDAAIVDVDYFCLQNLFELGYPELIDKTVALINIGNRYSGVNIVRSGQSLFTGDVSVAGKQFTDVLVEATGQAADKVEKLKRTLKTAAPDAKVDAALKKQLEQAANEFNRQLSFFWSASGADDGIDQIMLSGGASVTPGLMEALAAKTGLECSMLDPFRGIDVGTGFDQNYLKEVAPLMSVGVGLALRVTGDRIDASIEDAE